MQKRSVINSPGITEFKRKKYIALKKRIIIFIVLFVVFFIALCFVSNIKKINIDGINITGNVVIDAKSIEEVIEKDLNGKYLGIFPKTNALIYPRKEILKDLSQKYKRLKNISIDIVNFKTLNINVREYEGKYLWCGGVTPELNSNSNQKCYFMDNSGYIFDEAPFFSGEIYFKLYGFLNNENPRGSYYFHDLFPKIMKFKNSLEQMGLKPSFVWVNNQDETIVGLSKLGVTPINPQILLKNNSDYEKMAENLQSAIETEPLKIKLVKDYAKLLYIDLRYGNKVYYKFQ